MRTLSHRFVCKSQVNCERICLACSGYFLLCHSLLLLVLLLLHGFITYANATKAQRGAKCFGNLLSYCRACVPVCGCACARVCVAVWVRVCVHFRWVLALLYLHAVCHIRWQRFLAFSLSAKYFPAKQKKAPAVAATAAAEAVAAENHICRACLFGRDTRARVTRVICAAQLQHWQNRGPARSDLNRNSAMQDGQVWSAKWRERWVAAQASLRLWQLRQRAVKHTHAVSIAVDVDGDATSVE